MESDFTLKEVLINHFLNFSSLSNLEINALTESMDLFTFEKGSYMLKEGQFNTSTYFILKGCVRQYKTIDGLEISTNFFTEGQWIVSLSDMDTITESQYYLQCVEGTTVVIGNEKKAQELFKVFPHFETISRKIMEAVFLEQQEILASYIIDKPEQRYLKLFNTKSNILQRVAQYDIATYIGVKPESLSRIRRKMKFNT